MTGPHQFYRGFHPYGWSGGGPRSGIVESMSPSTDPVSPGPDRGTSEVVGIVIDAETDSWLLGSVVAELAHAGFRPLIIAPTVDGTVVGLGQRDLTDVPADELTAMVLLGAPSDETGEPDEGLVGLMREGFDRPCALLALREVADPLAAAGIDEDEAGVEVLDETAQIVPRLAALLPQRARWSGRRRVGSR